MSSPRVLYLFDLKLSIGDLVRLDSINGGDDGPINVYKLMLIDITRSWCDFVSRPVFLPYHKFISHVTVIWHMVLHGDSMKRYMHRKILLGRNQKNTAENFIQGK